jgi:mRNA-degrading endonuclease toxin of MazEF toxin-antitoxin module
MLISGDVIDVDLGLPAGHEAEFARPVVVMTAPA